MLAEPIRLDRRYKPLAASSTAWAFFLGSLAAIFPPLALLGIWRAVEARRNGSRIWWVVAVIWCIAAPVLGVWLVTTYGNGRTIVWPS